MIPGSANPLLLQSAVAAGGYQISRSLRFNQPDSPRLSRTPASAGNRKTWTWAGWVKRSGLGQYGALFVGVTGVTSNGNIVFYDNDTLVIIDQTSGSPGLDLKTTQVFRDTSSWYHIVCAVDTTQATSTNRVKLYINGIQVSSFGTASYPSQNYDTYINNTVAHNIGALVTGGNYYNGFNGYLADVYHIDGQALDPTSFGEFDATTGVWVPIEYTGTYGTNGFHLDFADNASTTTIGYDAAGSNDWTANNLSVTAGSGNDSLVDVPTNGAQTDTGVGGEVRGNYATLNPLAGGNGVLSNGNLDDSHVFDHGWRVSTIGTKTGKWYAEFTLSYYQNTVYLGITPTSEGGTTTTPPAIVAYIDNLNTQFFSPGSYATLSTPAASITAGAVWKIALDQDAGKLWYGYNSIWYDGSGGTTGNPATGANAVVTGLSASDTFFMYVGAYFASWDCNFGQRPFAYTAPSGFKALNTANLPAPLVTKPSTVFDVKLYTGTGSSQSITGLGFSPDFLWFKNRSGANSHALFDAVRGRAVGSYSDSTSAEVTSSAGNDLASFDAAGFTVGPVQSFGSPNANGGSIVAWAWDAGSSAAASNNSGTITSTVKANTSAGFSIATYTGTGANATVGHGLGVAPSMVIVKSRNAANDWAVYHAANTAAPATDYLLLNSTAATADDNTYWNDTAPTSTVFSIGTNADVNTNTTTYVAYCFASVAGYSAFGSYTGNGSADGPMLWLGFSPRWVVIKQTNTTGNWTIWDLARNPYNVMGKQLYPNESVAEADAGTNPSFGILDFVSNGIKIRGSHSSFNTNGGTYIYAAFAESPFNYSRAR
jgi:hypothetical protein